jgi:ATP-dependent DNA helicase RecG
MLGSFAFFESVGNSIVFKKYFSLHIEIFILKWIKLPNYNSLFNFNQHENKDVGFFHALLGFIIYFLCSILEYMPNLETPLKNISLITPRYHRVLKKLGLFCVKDFLFYLPFRYDDFRKNVMLSSEHLEKNVTVEGKISKTKLNRSWKRKMAIAEIFVEDASGTLLKAVWFNQPYVLESLRQGETVRLSGKLTMNGKDFSMSSPAWEKSSRDATNTARLVPVYPETSGITSKWIRWQMKNFLPLSELLPDIIPADILEKYNLYDISETIRQLHFPDSREKLLRAQKRMAFQEMFLIQLKALEVRKNREGKKGMKIGFDEKLVKSFVATLPFKLTDAQRKASFEILKDLEKPRPMNRLLNGDVGSGKTIVAAVAVLETILSSRQATLMAPTEVLARQHFESFSKLFEKYDVKIALLTGSYKLIQGESVTRLEALEKIKNGKIDFVIGTHALIQKDVSFQNLALTIIDEQHRFGVAQRAAIQQETTLLEDGNARTIPHLLTMTATPIPRTLAIAFFGSLDLSILDEMPKNRKPIITKIIPPDEQEKIYSFTGSEIKKGRQAFVIFPLVEESTSESMLDVKAAVKEREELQKVFPEFKIGLLHGRMKAKEKEDVMRKFHEKEFHILVSTSVVEVGIDVPNSTIIIIENSERFGLTQLHQFRGRVGRGAHQSYCFLFSKTSAQRLKILEKSNDGFLIAEKDLELRGPGQFFGHIQSGVADIAMENLSNLKLIKFARAESLEILSADPQLKKHPLLKDALQKFSEKVHLE